MDTPWTHGGSRKARSQAPCSRGPAKPQTQGGCGGWRAAAAVSELVIRGPRVLEVTGDPG